MQAYSSSFAKAYNTWWSGFARQVAPDIQKFYEATAKGEIEKTLLDLCCGTGQLAAHFLQQGYRVVGIDLSEPMLSFAKENAREYIDAGVATFIQADATSFTLDERFGLVTSTFDALNHLADEQALKQCFQRVFRVCNGVFIFDLNTRLGLKRWNGVSVDDSEDALIINSGIFDSKSGKGWVKITGFIPTADGLFERFEQTAFSTAFEMERVRELLLEIGWRQVHFARAEALAVPIDQPETVGRVFIVAMK